MKAEMVGADDGMSKEAVYLGRKLKWVPDEGVRVHPDQRHVQRLLEDLGLENSQGLSTPCAVRMDSGKGVVDITKPKELLPELPPPQQARRHRAGVARVVYVSQDRVDLGYVGVELAKTMATPRQGDPELLLRVGKYLATRRDVYQAYPY